MKLRNELTQKAIAKECADWITILKALTLPQEIAEELSANAKKYAQEKYSLSQMREKYIALIENLYKQ